MCSSVCTVWSVESEPIKRVGERRVPQALGLLVARRWRPAPWEEANWRGRPPGADPGGPDGPTARLAQFVCRMNTLKVALISVKELKDEKGRGLEEGKLNIWCSVTLDSSGQSVDTNTVEKCSTCWTGTEFNKKMSLCVHLVPAEPTPSADDTAPSALRLPYL